MNVVSATDLRLIEKPDFLTGEGVLDAWVDGQKSGEWLQRMVGWRGYLSL